MQGLFGFISWSMVRPASSAVALAAALLLTGAASTLSAQSSDQKPAAPLPRMLHVPGHGTVLVQPVPTEDPLAVGRTVIVPGFGNVYAVPVQPKDIQTPRQRCVDEQVANEGGSPSPLAQGAIDLKCSQR